MASGERVVAGGALRDCGAAGAFDCMGSVAGGDSAIAIAGGAGAAAGDQRQRHPAAGSRREEHSLPRAGGGGAVNCEKQVVHVVGVYILDVFSPGVKMA